VGEHRFRDGGECVDLLEAGAVPLAALTARQALVDTADVQPGQRVLSMLPPVASGASPSRSPGRSARL
jgi:hypothetical protein